MIVPFVLIVVDFEKLGFVGEKDPRRVELSYTKRAVLLNEMLTVCQDYIAREFVPILSARIKGILWVDDWQLQINSNDLFISGYGIGLTGYFVVFRILLGNNAQIIYA